MILLTLVITFICYTWFHLYLRHALIHITTYKLWFRFKLHKRRNQKIPFCKILARQTTNHRSCLPPLYLYIDFYFINKIHEKYSTYSLFSFFFFSITIVKPCFRWSSTLYIYRTSIVSSIVNLSRSSHLNSVYARTRTYTRAYTQEQMYI